MNRIITFAAAALIAGPVIAQDSEEMPQEMTMLQQRLGEALSQCNVSMDEEAMMDLSMAQVAGIVLAANSGEAGDTCQRIEAISRGDM